MAINLDFLIIPAPVLTSGVPDSAKILYGAIYALSQLSTVGCTASNDTLMQSAAIKNEKTLNRLLKCLEDARLIKRLYYDKSKVFRKEIVPQITYSRQQSLLKPVDKLGIIMGISSE